MCASLCLQHKVNEVLDNFVKGKGDLKQPDTEPSRTHKFYINK